MATSRQRGDRWEFCVRRKGLLARPVYLSFPTREEGEAYCARIERLLDAGTIPEELADKSRPLTTINLAHEHYASHAPVSAADESYFPTILKRWGATRLTTVDYAWVERQVGRCKDEWHLAPSSIRHQMGALARLFDWLLVRRAVATNPFRALRRGYASGVKSDVARDRRLSRDEEVRLIAALDGELLLLFLLALETAMRMREMYTLDWSQVDADRRTIFLDKTKNGDKRQVPMSSVALELLGGRGNGRVFHVLWDGRLEAAALRSTTSRISVAFGRATDALGFGDLRFHDLRHEATCRLYERTTLGDVQISLITGHKDLRMLRRYANLRGSDLAERLW